MPKMTMEQFCELVQVRKANGFSGADYTIVILGGHHEGKFFAPLRYRTAHGKFLMEATNEYTHPFVLHFQRHADGKTLEMNFARAGAKVVTLVGKYNDFLYENLRVTHHDGMRSKGVGEDIVYQSEGRLEAVFEAIATPQRVSNTHFKQAFYPLNDVCGFIKRFLPTLDKLV